LTSSDLFEALFVPDAIREAVSDRAWIAAMLEFEAALATAEALAGVIPDDAAEAIAVACDAERFDAEALGRRYREHRSRT
jgi:3-carboxy-cis,cis-muconate cycloisomerase